MVIHSISTGVCHYFPHLPCIYCKLPYFHFSFLPVLLRSAHYFTLPTRIWICLPYKPCFTLIYENSSSSSDIEHNGLFFTCHCQYSTENQSLHEICNIDFFSFWRNVIETMTWTQTNWKIKETAERQRRTDGKSRRDTLSQRIPRISKNYLKLAPTCHKRYSGV